MLSALISVLLVQATALDDPPRPKKPPTLQQLEAITQRRPAAGRVRPGDLVCDG